MMVTQPTEMAGLALPTPIIHNLLYTGNIILLHGMEESFKSILVLQLAECLALGTPFLRTYPVPHPLKVGLIETEIDEAFLGLRFRQMGTFPPLTVPTAHSMKDFRRAKTIQHKLKWVQELVDQSQLDFLIVDVVNDFFRGENNPSREQDVGQLFDGLRSMGLKGVLLVRHDKKFQYNKAGFEPPSSNEHIRGSGEWKEDPETILWIHRLDKRMHEAELEVGKMRYGRKPDPLTLWFDAGTFRLTPLDPILALLETGPQTREQLLLMGKERFDLGQGKVDKLIRLQEESKLIYERQKGHQKEFAIDWALAREMEPRLIRPLEPQPLVA